MKYWSLQLALDDIKKQMMKRCDHSAAIFTHTPDLALIFIFGGCIEWIGTYIQETKEADVKHALTSQTVVLQLGKLGPTVKAS
jgi:hypothetical protein